MKKVVWEEAEVFVEYCQELFHIWQAVKRIFDPKLTAIYTNGRFPYGLATMNRVLHQSFLLELAKLHDPAKFGDRYFNLSLSYIIEYGDWTSESQLRLQAIKERMDVLFKKIELARKKVLAHHDLEVASKTEMIGAFELGEDEQYFVDLQKFVDEVGAGFGKGIQPLGVAMVLNDLDNIADLLAKDSQDYFEKSGRSNA